MKSKISINLKQIRTLLKKSEGKFISVGTVIQVLKLKKVSANATIEDLEELGYIEKSTACDEYWQVSFRGKVLINKVFTKEFKVSTLKKHLEELIERAKVVNSSTKYPFSINCIKVVSEYPIENRSTGISIGYSLSKKKLTEKQYDAASNQLRKEYKGSFGNISAFYGYPYVAIRQFLKSRSNVLKLDLYDIDEMNESEGHIIFISKNAAK